VGLNIVEANQVILLDPWWNESIEQQAIDRVFRIGQKKDVRVFKFVMQDSIEDRVMDIQQAKTNLISNALAGIKGLCQLTEGASSTVSRNARREDVQKLFGIQS
jgi:SWI/SNF-related matrix-associated actin-dependent regulator of chromatin subfamily A3